MSFSSLPILAKFAIPAAIAACVATAIVIYASIVIAGLSGISAQLVDGEAARLQCALTAQSEFNNAAISEKNAILAAGDAKAVAEAIAKYATATDAVLACVTALERITPDAAQRGFIATFRQAVNDRRSASAHVFELAMANKAAAAYQYSRQQAAGYRQIAIAAIKSLIQADSAGMKAARDGSIVLAARTRLRLITGGAFGLSAAFGLLAWIALAQIGRPLAAITREMMRLAKGDLDIALPGIEKQDEIGALTRALQVFRKNAQTALQVRREQDAERAAREARHHKVEDFIASFDEQVRISFDALNASSGGLQTSAATMAADASESSRQVNAVTQASNEASAGVQAVAAATEQLHRSISEISRQVADSAALAAAAVAEVGRSTDTVGKLAGAANAIGEVIRLIQAVASKTNLLALNATIEASRAGDAGRGFAVVASEVKDLASQTAGATAGISAQIAAIQAETAEAVRAIGRIGGTINQMSSIATAIASAVEQQNYATRDIAQNIQEVSRGTAEVTANIAGVGAAAGSTGTAADHVNRAARDLAAQATRLRGEVNDFFAKIRSA